ncbi:MAG: ribosome maturation factor RimM [Balneolaceae bacterium]|nr:ribosome maturation factor RimM [Balneolaceae bacterium]
MLEPIETQYLLVGRINRPHGVHGELLIISELQAPDLFDENDLVYLQNSRGDLVPARIESVRVDTSGNRLSFFVQFEHVTDRTEAEQLKNFPVYVSRQVAEPLLDQTETPADYTGFQVLDTRDQPLGEVTFTIDNPAHPILQVATKKGRDMLIPFVDEYIRLVDEEEQVVKCHNLEQLEGI